MLCFALVSRHVLSSNPGERWQLARSFDALDKLTLSGSGMRGGPFIGRWPCTLSPRQGRGSWVELRVWAGEGLIPPHWLF